MSSAAVKPRELLGTPIMLICTPVGKIINHLACHSKNHISRDNQQPSFS